MQTNKLIIYQALVRLFGNEQTPKQINGTRHENGCGTFACFTSRTLEQFREQGISHIWYTGVLDHATQTDYSEFGKPASASATVKGMAGSPYAIRDYFDVAPDLADNPAERMTEFEELIERTHAAGLKAMIDFVPNHLARTYHAALDKGINFGAADDASQAFSPGNDFYYLPNDSLRLPTELPHDYEEHPAKATGNDAFTASPSVNDWYETVKLNYGVNYLQGETTETPIKPTALWHKMLAILEYWASKGVDGFRCDMVEMVPLSFWQWVLPQMRAKFPEVIFIAEVYDEYKTHLYLGAKGFDYLYDKTGLYNRIFSAYREHKSALPITEYLKQTAPFAHQLVRFLENHDEVRLASPQFLGNAEHAKAGMTVVATAHRGPVMIYFGQELGETAKGADGFSGNDGKTSIYDYTTLKNTKPWLTDEELPLEQRALRTFYRTLYKISTSSKAIQWGAFYDLTLYNAPQEQHFNARHLVAYVRHFADESLLIVANFHRSLTQYVHLRFSDEQLKTLGWLTASSISGTDLLQPEMPRTWEITPELLQTRGVQFPVAPHDAYVFKISTCYSER